MKNRKVRSKSRRGFSALAMTWLVSFTSVGLWLVLGGHANSAAHSSTVLHQAQLVTKNIEEVEVGQRVLTPGTNPEAALPTDVDPLTWKLLTLRLVNRWDDGTVDEMRVRTLQNANWVAENDARVGRAVPVPLDLKEMGVPDGSAEVVAVDPCPRIKSGPGRVVLTTVNHLNSFLFDLKVQGERAPPQSVFVTGYHKLYSEDRGAWISVCELKQAERLRGRNGPLMVASVSRAEGTERVYNMTVEGEHVYYVSGPGLLAHNTQCGPMMVDPGDLRLPPSRTEVDLMKLSRQITEHGESVAGMPPIQVTQIGNGELMINDGVTRATRAAKYCRQQPKVPVIITERDPTINPNQLPRVRD